MRFEMNRDYLEKPNQAKLEPKKMNYLKVNGTLDASKKMSQMTIQIKQMTIQL